MEYKVINILAFKLKNVQKHKMGLHLPFKGIHPMIYDKASQFSLSYQMHNKVHHHIKKRWNEYTL